MSHVNRPTKIENLSKAFRLSEYFLASKGNLSEACVSRDRGGTKCHVGKFVEEITFSDFELDIAKTMCIYIASKYAHKPWCVCTSVGTSKEL